MNIATVWRRGKASGLAITDQSIVSAGNFLSIYLLARYMDTEQFGVFMLAQTAILLTTNLHNALIVEPQNVLASSLEAPAFSEFLGALIPLQLMLSAVLALLVFLIGFAIVELGHLHHMTVVLILPVVLMACLVLEFVRRTMYARGEVSGALVVDSIYSVVQLTGIAVLVMSTPADTPLVLAVMGAAALLAVSVGAWQLRSRFMPKIKNLAAESVTAVARRIWEIGRWLLGRSALSWVGTNGHGWFVAGLLGAETLGMYRATIHLINIINPLRQAAASYLPPRGALLYQRRGCQALSRWVGRTGRILLAAVLPVAVVLMFFPEFALRLAYGNKFTNQGLGIVLSLAMTVQLIQLMKFPLESSLLAVGHTKWLFIIGLVPVVLLLSLAPIMIANWGLLGVVCLALISASLSWISTYLVYRWLVVGNRPALGMEVQ